MQQYSYEILLFQRLHCGCVASKNSYDLLDSGGVQCVTCMKNSAAQSVSSFFLSHYPPFLFKYSDCIFYRLLAKWFQSLFHVQVICVFSVKVTSYCQVENLNNHPLLCWIPEMLILLL
jgi:hypothetical protein